MKEHITLETLVATTLLMTTCGDGEATMKNESKGGSNALVVLAFGLDEDIIKKDIIVPFEKGDEAKVTLEVGNGADRFTKLKNNPNAGINVIELTQANAAQDGEEGLFGRITEKGVPNLSQLTSGAEEVLESGAGIPIAVNSIGIVHNKEKLDKEIKNWDGLWSADLEGKVSVSGIATTVGPLMLYVASEHAGQDITKDNGEAAFKAMRRLKPNVAKTYLKSSNLASIFQSGEIKAAAIADFAVDITQGAAENVTYVVPESGTYANYNTINIPKKTQSRETVFKFVNARINEEPRKAKAISLNEGPTNQRVTLGEKEARNKTYGTITERTRTVDFNFINSQLADWISQ